MGVMASLADRRTGASPLPRQVNWRGRSGRFYALTPEKLETFALATDSLYLLARGTIPMWVGSAHDVIHDPQSRSRFRLALATADRAFAVETDGNELTRMTVVWDLEGAEPLLAKSA